MKRIVAIIACVVMVLSMAGCGKENEAKDAVGNLLEALKEGDVGAAQDYLLKETDGEGGLEEDDMLKQVFTKLDYDIVSAEKAEDGEYYVSVSISAPDMKVAVSDFYEKVLEFAIENQFSDTPISDEEMEFEMGKIFTQSIEREDLGRVENTVSVRVCETDDGWRVESNEEFADAITGGMMTALSEMSQSMSEEDTAQ